MQRLFTVFPGGAPGAALVLLRVSVAGSLCLPLLGNPATGLGMLCLTATSVLLLLGLATPLVSLATAGVEFLRLLDATHVNPASTVAAVALALIGPGAFSIDARLFGRRVVASS